MDDRPIEDAPPELRQSRDLAIAGLLALITAAWLPWWQLTFRTGGVGTISGRIPVKLFGPVDDVTTIMPHVTGGLLVVVAAWIFVRIAGRSILYEPDTWRRDTVLQAALAVIAVASVGAWPAAEFGFWGGRSLGNETVQVIVEQTYGPVVGFWLAALGAMLMMAAAWRSKRSPTH